NQGVTDLALLGTGQTIVTWTSVTSGTAGDGSSNGVFGRIVNADGTFAGDEFQINQVASSSQEFQKVVATSTGFLVAWTDGSGQDGSGSGVQARFFDAAGAPLTDEFTVNENRSSTQSEPAVTVLDDGRIVIAWQTQQAPGGSGADVSGQIFAPTGERIDGEFRINTEISSTQNLVDVGALPGNNFVAVWTSVTSGSAGDGSGNGIFQQIFGEPADFAADTVDTILGVPEAVTLNEADVNAGPVRVDPDKTAAVPTLGETDFDGAVLEVSVDLSTLAISQFAPPDNLAQNQLSFLNGDVGNGDVLITGAVVSIDGQTVGAITSDGSDGQPLTVTFNANATAESVEALLGALAYANTSQDPEPVRLAVNLTTGANVSSRTEFIDIAISADDDLGHVAGEERRVNAHTDEIQEFSKIVELTGGGWAVVWESRNQDSIDDDFDEGVYAQVYDANGVPVGPEIQVHTTTALTQFDPDVAATSDGGFVVVWAGDGVDDPGVNDTGIIAQRFNADGSTNGGEVVINNPVALSQFAPSVSAFDDGGYVVAFVSDTGDGASAGIRAARVDAAGAVIDETTVNGLVTGSQSQPDVATRVDPVSGNNAGYVVVWTDPASDGSNSGVRGRMFDAAGLAVGSDFPVNTSTSGNQSGAAVATLADGGFVVVWTDSNANDGSGSGVYGQRYDASGTAVGGEFRVNDTTASSQSVPDISALANGGFVVAWEGSGVGDGSGVFTQSYDANGARVDAEQRVNVLTSGAQFAASVTGLASGGYAVSYTSVTSSSSGDGSSNGVFLRSFEPSQPAAVSPEATDVARSLTLGADDVTAAPVILDDGIGLVDPDSADFDGGALRVYYTRGPAADDQLTIETSGAVSVSGADVSVGGTVIGVIDATDDGANGADLLVTFNADAQTADVKAVVEALAFSSTDTAANVANTERGIGFIITDGDGGQSEPDSIFLDINVGSVVQTGLTVRDFAVSENENAESLNPSAESQLASDLIVAPRLLDANVDLDDFAGTSFDTGFVRVTASSNRQQTLSVQDQGTGPGQIGFDGTTVTFGGVAIGTIDPANAGQNGANLQIDLNAAATVEAAEALAEAFTIQLSAGLVGSFSNFTLSFGNQAGQTASSNAPALTVIDDVVQVLPAGTDEALVNTFTFDDQASPHIAALANGGYVVVWTSESQDNPAETATGIFAQIYSPLGDQVGVEFQVNDLSVGIQSQPQVEALSTGDFVVAWTDAARDGSVNGVFAQRYDGTGVPQGAVFLVNQTTASGQDSAQIADLGGGRFLMVWRDLNGEDGSGQGIFGRVFDASGAPEGDEFQINTSFAGSQNRPRTTTLEDGDVMVVWQDQGADGSSTGIFAQRIDSTGDLVAFDGSALGVGVTSDEQLINTVTVGAQNRGDVAALAPSATLPNGGFVVVWNSAHDGTEDVYAQIYAIDGSPVGGEFRVNTLLTSSQADPVAVGAADGSFTVIWREDSAVDGSGSAVVAQKVQPDGSLDGASFIVNSETISTQDQPEIASLNNGALIAVWRTFAENSSTSDVAQTIIDPAAVPAGAMSPVLVGFESVVTLDEQDVNAGLQLVDPDGVISLTDMDSSDFDGGSLLVQRVSGSAGTFEQQLGELDGLGQEQIGFLAGDGVTLSGATVRVDGTAIGTIVEDGTVGAPLRVDFNANATPELVERLLTRLAYANQSDDPAATRQFAVQVSDGEGGSTGSQLLTVEVTPETDLAQASIGPDERVNSYTEGAQDMSASATLFDPNTGLPT
ncbi:MAG: hypothetical protein AAFU61_02685, partial [Pseudomonadota bacterium]